MKRKKPEKISVQAVNNQSKQRDKRFGGELGAGSRKRADKVPAAKAKTHCECEYSWNFHLLSGVAWGCIVRNAIPRSLNRTEPSRTPPVIAICRFVLLLPPLQLSLHFCSKVLQNMLTGNVMRISLRIKRNLRGFFLSTLVCAKRLTVWPLKFVNKNTWPLPLKGPNQSPAAGLNLILLQFRVAKRN